MPLDVDQFNDAEKALWEAFPTGDAVILTGRPQRTVRAQVIEALLRGARPVEPGGAPKLVLTGAHITGKLDLNCAKVEAPLWLDECDLDEAPDFAESYTRSINIIRSRLPGFQGKMMRVDGQLRLNESEINGRLILNRATITGELTLRGARLINPDGWALFAGGLTVESAVFGVPYPEGGDPLYIEGGVRLVGARLLGGVFLDGVHILRPGGIAWQGDNMHVFGRMLCGFGFRAEGAMLFPHARFEGELSFGGAILDGGISLNNATVDDLNLRTAQPMAGVADMRHAKCALLRDSLEAWPDVVALDGFVYDAIDTTPDGLEVHKRLAWLKRERNGYRPQPYEQLAALYRRLGADSEARQVLLGKQRAQRHEHRLPARIVGYLLDWTVGYGYKPWRAAIWLAVMLAVGTSVFSARPPVPVSTASRLFDPFIYTMDLLLPISAFGLRDAFAPVGSTRWLAYGLTAAGWLLATALIAGVTRALRRD